MTPHDAETEELLARASRGDCAAQQQLLGRHCERLRKMVALWLERLLSARIDPSDVAQEAELPPFPTTYEGVSSCYSIHGVD